MKKYLSLLILITMSKVTHAQMDSVSKINKNWIPSAVSDLSGQYLVFFQNGSKPKVAMTQIWDRKVNPKKLNGRDLIEVTQKWYGSDTTNYRYLYSLVDATTFLPVYHKTWTQRAGTEAFDFYPDKIKGSDSVNNNNKKGFEISLSKLMLNWELDLETFTMLPLGLNKTFAINFYHPGSKQAPPAVYQYKVTGETKLPYGNTKVDCWMLKIDYNGRGTATFYISKKTREVLKMEEEFGSIVRYKVKLPLPIKVR